ncbi:uncharacterized protein LOC124266940 [Haliotis rubra]|uniref:uncharacterized protein LOC124266940 n=1 Tax=Haliotis rubra TaxID=36100 RepID=UPI001EE5018A|nr:uncharacterized protein LOC124266940 [Haliotis rubra]
MELMLACSFACLIVPISGSLMCSPLELFGPIQMNLSVVNVTFETVDSLGLLHCVRECYVKRRCKSFNYESQTETCFLNSKTDTEVEASDRVNIANIMYSNIADWSGKLAGACNNHTCPLDSVCVDRNDVAACETIYCKNTTSPVNGVVQLGGRSFFNQGDEMEFSCSTGYLASGKIVCEKEGVWNSTALCTLLPLQPRRRDGV